MSAPATVSLRAVRKTYGTTIAVENLNLDIAKSSFFTLLGPSGSGKTTTLRLIAGFEFPDTGAITLAGHDVSHQPPHLRDVNTVFQDYALFPHMSLLENVAYGLRARRIPTQQALLAAGEALERVRLSGLGERKPGQLSGGQRQRVALARAMVNRPAVLRLDEPLGALDLKLRHQMQTELKALQHETGITFVYVTHDQEEALTMSDRVAVFNHGRIEQEGSPFDIYERPETSFVADFVGSSTLLRRGGRLLMVRPEKVRLHAANAAIPANDYAEPGIVRSTQYLGIATRITVELEDGTQLLATWQNAHADDAAGGSGVGMAVLASWRPEDAYPLPETIL
jgi:putative spermidine/putrescine transport system ATP-binding protein